MATGKHLLWLAAWLAAAPQTVAQRGITVSQKSAPLFAEVAWFDTWVEGLPGADYSEGVYADFSILEWQPERVAAGASRHPALHPRQQPSRLRPLSGNGDVA